MSSLQKLGNYQKIFILCLSEEQWQNIGSIAQEAIAPWFRLKVLIRQFLLKSVVPSLLQKIAEESGLSGGTVALSLIRWNCREDRERSLLF